MWRYLLTLFLVVRGIEGGDKKVLRLLGLQAMTGEAWPGGWSCHVPVQLAIGMINSRDDILKDYTLEYDHIDHEVSGK